MPRTTGSESPEALLEARPVIPGSFSRCHILCVGGGGTGSLAYLKIAHLVRRLRRQGRLITLTVIDPDLVEEKNIERQNFCEAEIGLPKAVCLATRYNQTYGLDAEAKVEEFTRGHLIDPWRDLNILIGCVDNAAGRVALHEALQMNPDPAKRVPTVWWLDAGNKDHCGQVLLGSAYDARWLAGAFQFPDRCIALPSPLMQEPKLGVPRPEELAGPTMSCAELEALNRQSPTINFLMAGLIAHYLEGFLVEGAYDSYASYLYAGRAVSVSPRLITPQAISRISGKDQTYLTRPLHSQRGARR